MKNNKAKKEKDQSKDAVLQNRSSGKKGKENLVNTNMVDLEIQERDWDMETEGFREIVFKDAILVLPRLIP